MFSEKKTKSVLITLFICIFITLFICIFFSYVVFYNGECMPMSYFLNDLEEFSFSFLNRVLFCLSFCIVYVIETQTQYHIISLYYPFPVAQAQFYFYERLRLKSILNTLTWSASPPPFLRNMSRAPAIPAVRILKILKIFRVPRMSRILGTSLFPEVSFSFCVCQIKSSSTSQIS